MRKFAKLLSMLLVVATLVGLCALSASAAEFKDISAKDEALYEAVQLLNSLGIAKGQSETTYGANKPVTREQMSAFIYRMMKQGKSLEGGENTTPFTDLKDDTFFGMIAWAHASGVIKGISETEFDPEGKITLQDSYVMLSRALGYEKDGALNYPHDYIDIAETIGLNENLDEELLYTDFLNRGQVAIILHNAFYADMKETYKYTYVARPEKPITGKYKSAVTIEKHETIFHKIYDMEIIHRRVVATPNYAIDLSAVYNFYPNLDNPGYIAYTPTIQNVEDKEYIMTAAIVPGESSVRVENEKAMIAFEDLEKLGLTGKADDYFLRDLTLYVKKDGTIMAASAFGKYVENSKLSVVTSDGENLSRDYYHSSENGVTAKDDITKDGKIRTGAIKFGTDLAYFYDIPDDVDNSTWSIYPSVDNEGRMTFKAAYTWAGNLQPQFNMPAGSFSADPIAYMNTMRTNHQELSRFYANAGMGSYYNVEYYDSNGDGVVEYFWMQPYTFGWIVDKTTESSRTTAVHKGESANRAHFNSSNSRPEIYIGKATVEGGSYTTDKPVFAYVSGPANYVRIASDEENAAIKYAASTSPLRLNGSDYNSSSWDAGFSINAYNSQNIVVGHVNWVKGGSLPTAIVNLSDDLRPNPVKNYSDTVFHSPWRSMLAIGQEWEIYHANSRFLWGRLLEDTQNLAEQYAIVDYINYDNKIVVFNAGGIDFDASLEYDPHVWAYIGGKRVIVPIAKKVDGVDQDSEYFIDNKIVNELSTYTVDKNGKYTFKPYDFDNASADAADLSGKDSDATYTVTASLISLDKFNDTIYEFVPGDGYTQLPAALKPNDMKFVSVDEDTLIIVKYVNEDDEDDFMVYSGDTMPNFDAEDAGMSFTEAYIVIENNPDSTITERLSFLYCVIGGEIVDASKSDDKYALIMGNKTVANEENKTYTVYNTFDPFTATSLGEKIGSKESTAVLADYSIYEITDLGDIKNSDSGKLASLAYGSRDLTTIESFEKENNLLLLGNGEYVLVDENSVYTHINRYDNEIEIIDADVLTIEEADDQDDEYYNAGESKLTVFVMSEEVKGEDLELATLVIVVNG